MDPLRGLDGNILKLPDLHMRSCTGNWRVSQDTHLKWLDDSAVADEMLAKLVEVILAVGIQLPQPVT